MTDYRIDEDEQALLAGVLSEMQIPPEIPHLNPDDFGHPAHKRIWSAIRDLHELGERIDPVAVSNRVNGDKQAILDLPFEDYVTVATLSRHAERIRAASVTRAVSIVLSFFFSCIKNSNFDANDLKPALDMLTEYLQVPDLKGKNERLSGITGEVRDLIESHNGAFSVTGLLKELQTNTNVTKDTSVTNVTKLRHTINVALTRLRDEGIIESIQGRRGYYQRIDPAATIDWQAASTDPIPIMFPLEIERLVTIYPRNIIVYAGTQNAGKTAHLLNLAFLNRDLMKTKYLCSEMAAQELKVRLDLFGHPYEEWKKIEFRERSASFASLVDPDGLTIIDFLELNDNFYQIAGLLREIYDKLRSGVCVVGLQKPLGRDTGRGGDMGLEKPRLYLAVDPGRIKIVKAKAWTNHEINPNGLVKEYKLLHGCKFVGPITDWMTEAELKERGTK